ncbi:MAG: hypothetical protein AMJ53_14625 [Gammaproteobacteria bacterium SG8_11]|nr:MAG: hypothetical protein AMJ53_14625 [Gammaproteobacteria bacterium SG8_11]
MRKYVILLFGALSWGSIANAEEHVACTNLDYDYQVHSSKDLRDIAATCQARSISQLYYNRAYHVDLLKEGEVLSQIVAMVSRDLTHYIEAYRFYIALIESFAPTWYPDANERVDFLNHEYDRRGEVTELRLHGYDRIADLKEKQINLQ